ncbi:ABC transporter substrate-binding protein, partial [Streptococcus pyogenes]
QAVALSIDRSAMLKATKLGFGSIGNDHPFAPAFPYSVPIPQRQQDIEQAKQLLTAAGHPDGFSATLTTASETSQSTLAQMLQASL